METQYADPLRAVERVLVFFFMFLCSILEQLILAIALPLNYFQTFSNVLKLFQTFQTFQILVFTKAFFQ